MKKLLLALVALLVVTGASAQDWSVGGRVGSGLQALGQYKLSAENYVEARFGAAWFPGVNADFTALYNWHLLDFDWTPSAGKWFFDAGVGLNVGGQSHFAYFGAAGMARLGFTFNEAPITLAFDYTPVLGMNFHYAKGFKTNVGYHGAGWGNFGFSCTYNF